MLNFTGRAALSGAALAVLAACASSPPPQYFTLTPPQAGSGQPNPAFATAAVEFLPISVPQQVDQPNIMVRTAPQELTPDYNARWAANLGEEVKAGLAASLQQTAGITDITGLGNAGITPTWRLQIQVRRFDMPTQGPATFEALWRARRLDDAKANAWLCRTEISQTATTTTVAGLVEAQRQAVTLLAQRMAPLLQHSQPPSDCRAENPSPSAPASP